MTTPADQGIEAAKKDNQARLFMSNYADQLKAFILDQISEGMHHEFDDHNKFLMACCEEFTIMQEEIGG